MGWGGVGQSRAGPFAPALKRFLGVASFRLRAKRYRIQFDMIEADSVLIF